MTNEDKKKIAKFIKTKVKEIYDVIGFYRINNDCNIKDCDECEISELHGAVDDLYCRIEELEEEHPEFFKEGK